jgi:hypothetical protein
VADETIPGDEILFRRIPPSQPPDPPDLITTGHFKLRKRDKGLSVYRRSIVSAEEVLGNPDAVPGSFIVQATVSEIHSLTNAEGQPLHLSVLVSGDEGNPGHAEIRGPEPGKLTGSASRALKKLFRRP